VEKINGKIIAQIKSTLWAADYLNINRNFLNTLNEPLKDGIKILFLAKIAFDPSFGLSLQITDIDPQYTLGDLEKEKRETVKKLQLEGIFDKNKNFSFLFYHKGLL
jgi:exodeoxyribonuclease VII large subunit